MWVLLAFLAVAAASQSLIDQEVGFRAGKEYAYDYTSQTLTGVSVDNLQYAGLRIKSHIKFQPRDGPQEVMGTFTRVRIMKLNKELPHYHPTQDVPDSEWEQVDQEELRSIQQQLVKPFTFKVNPKGITHFHTQPDDLFWSANIKRGMLSFMQVDMQGDHPETPEELTMMNKLNLGSRRDESSTREKGSYVNRREKDINGICVSNYEMSNTEDEQYRRQRDSDPSVFHLTKVRNMESCEKRPVWKSGFFENVIFGNDYEMKRVEQWDQEAKYRIQGSRQQFLIRDAKQIARQHINRINVEQGKLITYTTQWFKLLSVDEARTPIRITTPLVLKDSLIMEIPEPALRDRRQDQEQKSEAEVRAQVNLIEELLQEAERKVTPFVQRNATVVMAKLTVMLKEIPVREIQNLVQKYCQGSGSRREMSQKGELLLDSMATCRRDDTVPIILNLVKNQKIGDYRGAHLMTQIALLVESTPKIAADLIQVLKSKQIPTPYVHTRRAATLALGAVAHKIHQKSSHREPRERYAQLEPIVDRIAQELMTLYDRASNKDEKLCAIKAMGNAGIPQLFGKLQQIIQGREEKQRDESPVDKEFLREKAVYALRRLAPKNPETKRQILNILMPIYKNPQSPTNLRIACFIVMTLTKPTYGELRVMSAQLQQERSLQVGSFVWSYMKSKSEIKNPVVANETAAYKKALTYARPFRPGFQYSKGYIADYYNNYYKSGGAAYLEYITSVQSILPQSFIFRNDYDATGFPFLGYEAGVEFKGSSTVLKNLLGPKSVLKDLFQGRYSLKDILEPIRHQSPEMLAHIRQAMDKISMTERSLRDFELDMYSKTLDIETDYMTLNPSQIGEVAQYIMSNAEELIRDLQRTLVFHKARALPIIDSSFTMPTPCGLHLSLNMTWNAVVSLNGEVQVSGLPSMRDLMSSFGSRSGLFGRSDDRSSKKDKNWRSSSKDEATLKVKLQPSVEVDLEVFVGVEVDRIRTGAAEFGKLYLNFPLDSEVKVDLDTGKLKTKIRPPQQSQTFLSMIVNTKTVIRKRPPPNRPERFYSDEKLINFPLAAQESSWQHNYRVPYVNALVGVYSERLIDQPGKKTTLDWALFGRKNYTMVWVPSRDQVREVSLETLFLGSERAERSQQLMRDLMDIDCPGCKSDSDSDSDEQDSRRRRDSDRDEDSDSWWWTPSLSWGEDRSNSHQDRRRSSDSSQKVFDRVETESSMSRPSKYKLITVLKTHGGRSEEKKIKIQATHVISDDLKKHQEDLQIIYKDPFQSSSQEKKIKLKQFTDIEVIKKWLVDEQQVHRQSSSKDLLSKTEIFVGPKESAQKKLDVELKMGRGQPLQSLSRVHTSRVYVEPTQGPIEVSASIDYHEIPHSVYKVCKKLKEMSKVLPYITKHVEVETEDARNPPNKVKLVAEFQTNETEIDLLILTPTETELIKGLPIPFLPKRDAVCSLSGSGCFNKWIDQDREFYQSSGSSPVHSFVHYISGGRYPGKCEVLGEEVQTYDKERIHLPKTDCETILAKDCSSQSNPEFMVTTKEKNKDEKKKIVYVYTPEKKIKVEPKDGWFESDMEVEVDDRKISVPEGQKVTIRKDMSDPRSEKICSIKKEHGKVKVSCSKAKVKVTTDGKDVEIQVHPTYYSTLCGVCSNYNSEPRDDLMGPRKERFQRPEQFLLSYIMPDSQCDYDEIRQRLARGVPQLFLPQNGNCQMMQRNRFIPRSDRSRGRLDCFSINPVNTCPDTCRRGGTVTDNLPFFCLSASSAEAQQLKRKWEQGQILNELRGKAPNWHQKVKIPKECTNNRDQQRQDRDDRQARNLVVDKDDILIKQ